MRKSPDSCVLSDLRNLSIFLFILFLASCSGKSPERISETPRKTKEIVSDSTPEEKIVLSKGCNEIYLETDKQLGSFQKNLLSEYEISSREALKHGFSKVVSKSDVENVESIIEFRIDKSYIRYYELSLGSKVLADAVISEASFPIYKNIETGLPIQKFLKVLDSEFGIDRSKTISECLEFIPLSEYEVFTFRLNNEKLIAFEYESNVEFF